MHALTIGCQKKVESFLLSPEPQFLLGRASATALLNVTRNLALSRGFLGAIYCILSSNILDGDALWIVLVLRATNSHGRVSHEWYRWSSTPVPERCGNYLQCLTTAATKER